MPFNSALSGLKASASHLQVIGNNIANAGTVGYRRSRTLFSDVYAASALATSSNAIGAGTKLNEVRQEFTQGSINAADSNLDLAINGNGFFRLDDSGSVAYTRAGAFRLDKDGFITNSSLQKLTGFQADGGGNITGALGTLKIENANLSPKSTAAIAAKLNLDAAASPPTTAFTTGFTPASPPSATSYNNSTSTTVYDSLGNSHNLTTYFVKAPAERTWKVHLGMDGTDITPSASAVPGGATPASYPAGSLAQPYTLVFDSSGGLIANNTAAPPQYYGAPPVDSTVTALTNSNALPILDIGDITLNGIPIVPPTSSMDTTSTTDKLSSGRALSAAINASSTLHGVTATSNAAIFDMGDVAGTGGGTTLTAGELTINNVQIIAAAGALDNAAEVVTAINVFQATTGVVASNPAGNQIVLTAADGRNIQMVTNGVGGGLTTANLNMNGGALDKVQRATFALNATNNAGITVGGTTSGDAGLATGPLRGIIQGNSDLVTVSDWNPATGAISPQALSLGLTGTTNFSAPFSITSLSQDGYGVGRLTSVDVDQEGLITARYGNGQSQNLGQVAIATFNSPEGLQPQGDSAWSETTRSGAALVGAPGTSNAGLIASGSLEDSNVSLTDELVELIVAQRNFQANAQTIRAADAITQTVINIRG